MTPVSMAINTVEDYKRISEYNRDNKLVAVRVRSGGCPVKTEQPLNKNTPLARTIFRGFFLWNSCLEM